MPMLTTLPELIQLYRAMHLLRAFDRKAIALHRTGKLGTFPSSLGQEAIFVGLGSAMRPEDVLCPYYRDHGALFQRGVSMEEIFTYWGGDERGNCFANAKEDFPICVPIASQCLHAAGVAYAFKKRKEPRVAVASCGDGATSKGDFYEALNLAGVWHLPLVFVINNNQWAISVPRTAQTAVPTLAQKATAAGFRGIQADGNDVVTLRQVISEAIEKARQGQGPCLIEALSYRLCDHTTADDARRYINEEEHAAAWAAEPIARLRKQLQAERRWSNEQEEALKQECQHRVAKAAESYLQMGPQTPESMFDYLYENLPTSLQAQRRALQGSGSQEEPLTSTP